MNNIIEVGDYVQVSDTALIRACENKMRLYKVSRVYEDGSVDIEGGVHWRYAVLPTSPIKHHIMDRNDPTTYPPNTRVVAWSDGPPYFVGFLGQVRKHNNKIIYAVYVGTTLTCFDNILLADIHSIKTGWKQYLSNK